MVEYKGDRVGQQLGPYRLTHLLGAGGFGEVYEADHQLLQQKRAIKLLLERHFHDPNQRERFLREARILATLEHPNILPVLEVGEESNMFYLVMPFYRRGTLNGLLRQRTTPLPLAEIERLLAQMCAAVGYAHARHIAHLDLKPDNMLMHEDGRLVLSDFGLAHLIKQGRLEAGSSASWGTPYYMAPEHIRGEPEPRSDLYALGVILYQLLTNQRPFTGTTPEAVMMKHLLEAPPSLHAASPEAPAVLEPVLRKALEKRPENRYATAEALLTDFHAAVSSSSQRVAQPSAPGVFPAIPTPMNGPAPVVQPTIPVPLNKTQATAAVCEVDNCGILAIGRCATCKRAFCASHQARSAGRYYLDRCAPCLAAKEAEATRRWNEAQAPYVYFESGAARTALLASGVPPVDIYKIRREWKTGLIGLGGRYIDVAAPVGYGWILGKFKWASNRKPDEKGVTYGPVVIGEDCLTALLDLSHDDPRYSSYRSNCGLAPVRPYSRGYETWDGVFNGKQQAEDLDGWRELAQAVRRLTGGSS